MRVADFEYDLPEAAIAQVPVEPRHDSRLLDTRDMSDHRFVDLPERLSSGDLVVVNETRVRAARLTGIRSGTGGKVELLILERVGGTYEALARPARRLRPGVTLQVGDDIVTVVDVGEGGVIQVAFEAEDPEAVISSAGTVPLPPYFKGELVDPERYQTVFAGTAGSAAAPTAGLHFTDELIGRLEGRGLTIARVDLHVSLDTFRPMTVDEVEDHVMHREWCAVPEATATAIDDTRRSGGRVVAIGTTVVRALEAHADGHGGVRPGAGDTRLFLRPGVPVTVADLLVTNFHLPGSTLLALLEAFMGREWRHVYDVALKRGYRFLSFGDAMLAARSVS